MSKSSEKRKKVQRSSRSPLEASLMDVPLDPSEGTSETETSNTDDSRPIREQILEQASIIALDKLKSLRQKQEMNLFDREDLQDFTKVVSSAVSLAKEEREQEKVDDPAEWDENTLSDALKAVLKDLGDQ